MHDLCNPKSRSGHIRIHARLFSIEPISLRTWELDVAGVGVPVCLLSGCKSRHRHVCSLIRVLANLVRALQIALCVILQQTSDFEVDEPLPTICPYSIYLSMRGDKTTVYISSNYINTVTSTLQSVYFLHNAVRS